jgi:hypothetical protein
MAEHKYEMTNKTARCWEGLLNPHEHKLSAKVGESIHLNIKDLCSSEDVTYKQQRT